MVPSHLTTWFDLSVENYKAGTEPKFGEIVYRFAYDWDNEDEMPLDMLKDFLAKPGVEETVAISLGTSSDTNEDFYEMAEAVIAAKDRLPKLRGLFAGEMEQEECEISWIHQSDAGKILEAFPGLEDLRVRGQEGLAFTAQRHIGLTSLIIETGGMGKDVLAGIAESVFPELETLALWLGTEDYGWDGSIDDVRPFLMNNPFPKLKHLALCNSDIQTDIAKLAAEAPVLGQLETLDLSRGVLKDEGGEALLASDGIKGLKKLDLHHHYMSDAVVKRFESLGIEVDVSEQEEADDNYYYVAVGE